MMANQQDDGDQNLEVDIYPKAVKVINQGSHSNKDDLEKLKAWAWKQIKNQENLIKKVYEEKLRDSERRIQDNLNLKFKELQSFILKTMGQSRTPSTPYSQVNQLKGPRNSEGVGDQIFPSGGMS